MYRYCLEFTLVFLEDDLCYRLRMILWHFENGDILKMVKFFLKRERKRKREGEEGGKE